MAEDHIADTAGSKRRGRCVTFHSYKGGLGRTLAVAGVAVELALRGGRVLAVDWDLDTPSLHLALGLDEDALADQPGLIEYIDRSGDEFTYLQSHQETGSSGRGALLSDYVTTIIPDELGSGAAGKCDLLAAGRFGEGYLKLLQRLDWRDLYAEQGGFWIMERLKLQAVEQYDLVLIDARAGRSNTTLIPLVQLSDLVVLIFAINEASVAGTASIASVFAGHARSPGWRPPPAILVPSIVRAEPAADTLRRQINRISQILVENAMKQVVPNETIAEFALPYDADIADGVIRSPQSPDIRQSPLHDAYSRIADAIMAQSRLAAADW